MTVWVFAGWAGNACFFTRSLVQWVAAERTRSNRVTTLFWLISLMGSVLLGAYAAHRGLAVLLAGFVTNGAIYLRNLQMKLRPQSTRTLASRPAGLFAVVAVAILVAAGISDVTRTADSNLVWLGCAIVGQAIWSSRFVLQWWHSERVGESRFPVAFWTMSLAGNLLLLAYALHLRDAVLIAGMLPGPVMQLRNLHLARSVADADEVTAETATR